MYRLTVRCILRCSQLQQQRGVKDDRGGVGRPPAAGHAVTSLIWTDVCFDDDNDDHVRPQPADVVPKKHERRMTLQR